MEIVFFCACFAYIWTSELTTLDGLLWFVPKIYPTSDTTIGKALRCGVCLSGWLCLALYPFFDYSWYYCFFAMTITKILISVSNGSR